MTNAVDACMLPKMISAGAVWNKKAKRFGRIGTGAWSGAGSALDSAGFVAMMKHGGYPWTVDAYVEMVVHARPARPKGDKASDELPEEDYFPWHFWSQMDFCCEVQIAPNRAEVERRMDLTTSGYAACLESWLYWADNEGMNWVPPPLPILQGRRPDDYVRAWEDLMARRDAFGVFDDPPPLVGVGSVCGREVVGEEGILPIVERLDRELPKSVKLHLFGVKSQTAQHVSRSRVASVDSMAWSLAARKCAHKLKIKNDNAHRAAHLKAWVRSQNR